MMLLRYSTLALGALLLLGTSWVGAEEKTKAAGKSDHLDRLAVKLKLDEAQKQQIREIHTAYDAKADPVEHEFWTLLRGEVEDIKKVMNDAQRAQLPEVVKGFHQQEMQKFAKELQLTDDQKTRIAAICETYEPKFQALASQTGKGDALPGMFRDLRAQMVTAIRAELTEEQRDKLPLVLRQEYRYWRNADVRSEHIKAAGEKLGFTADQKAQVAKISEEYEPKIKAKHDELKKLHQEEMAAIEKVLTEEQRTKFKELHKGRVTSEKSDN